MTKNSDNQIITVNSENAGQIDIGPSFDHLRNSIQEVLRRSGYLTYDQSCELAGDVVKLLNEHT